MTGTLKHKPNKQKLSLIMFCSLLVPVEQLNCESALYWQAVCKYIHDMGNDGDEYMEKVLPTCVDYCAYVQR